MFKIDDLIINLGIAIARPITEFTSTEKDDLVLDIVEDVTRGRYTEAIIKLGEIINPEE